MPFGFATEPPQCHIELCQSAASVLRIEHHLAACPARSGVHGACFGRRAQSQTRVVLQHHGHLDLHRQPSCNASMSCAGTCHRAQHCADVRNTVLSVAMRAWRGKPSAAVIFMMRHCVALRSISGTAALSRLQQSRTPRKVTAHLRSRALDVVEHYCARRSLWRLFDPRGSRTC